MRSPRLVIVSLMVVALLPAIASAQDGPRDDRSRDDQTQEHKRILWIIPNYRTSPTLKDYQPLSGRQKFKLATADALDPGTFVLAGLFAVDGQLIASSPSFGDGVHAYPKYYAAALSDFVVG